MRTLTQPAFVLAFTVFLLHQTVEKIFAYHIPFFDNYLDPFLCTPVMLTFLLFERRVFFKQGDTFILSILEIIVATIAMICISEILFPYFSSQFTADWHDGIGLSLGSVYFYCFINVRSNSV
jgi:hypothetical protein